MDRFIIRKMKRNTNGFIFIMCTLFFLLAWQHATALPYGAVLGLYKSSDNYTKDNNPLKWYFEKPLKSKGLRIIYHDFDSGFSADLQLENIRAIISWYNSPVVKDKRTGLDYLKFLHKAVEQGIKIISLNSFGIYGYKKDGKDKWDMIQYINPLFYKLGFKFAGFWTKDPKKLKIVKKNSSMVEFKAKQDVKLSSHYQRIVPLRDDVKTYLQIKRTDKVKGIGDGKSSVILSSKTGCFALEKYVLKKNALLLNPALFLDECLFYDEGYQNVAIIVGDLKNREKIIKNIHYAFYYAKINFDFLNPSELKHLVAGDLIKYEALLLAMKSDQKLPFRLMENYARNGGNIIFLRSTLLGKNFQRLAGIIHQDTEIEEMKKGYRIKNDFLLNGITYSQENRAINVRKTKVKNVDIVAEVWERKYRKDFPVAWVKSFNKGKIMFWNTTFPLDKKFYRGIIVQSIHYVVKNFVTSVANIGVIYIDDWPAPLWNTVYRDQKLNFYNKKLINEKDPEEKKNIRHTINKLLKYPKISDIKFSKKYWINDLKTFAREFGFKYSTYIIFNYNKQVTPDEFGFKVKQIYHTSDNLSIKTGKAILKNGWELGLHGFNHQSLTMHESEHYDSKVWTATNMLRALRSTKAAWQLIFGKNSLPVTYVAPHNIIDNKGEASLALVFPSIKVISTIYTSTEGETAKEFEYSQDRRFFYIPRISAGFIMDLGNRHSLYDAFHNFGVITHFIHPDDVFDFNRSSGFAGWEAMKKSFTADFGYIKKNFPWFRWYTTKDAFFEFLFYFNTNIKIKSEPGKITIFSSDGSDKNLFLRFRIDKGRKIRKVKNCKLVQYNMTSRDVIIKTNSSVCTVLLK